VQQEADGAFAIVFEHPPANRSSWLARILDGTTPLFFKNFFSNPPKRRPEFPDAICERCEFPI
jgi:hypothetical protein